MRSSFKRENFHMTIGAKGNGMTPNLCSTGQAGTCLQLGERQRGPLALPPTRKFAILGMRDCDQKRFPRPLQRARLDNPLGMHARPNCVVESDVRQEQRRAPHDGR